jgi:hypothetical protein
VANCAEVILRRCPACERDSIIDHGRRRKQAHDDHHDWIGIFSLRKMLEATGPFMSGYVILTGIEWRQLDRN